MDDAKLRNLQRQIAIGFQAVLEDLHMAGAVHGFERKNPLVLGLGEEHVLAIGLPMAGGFPQRAIQHLRRVDFDIARSLLPAAHVIDERLKQRPALGVPEHGAGAFFLKMEQVHLARQPAMIAALGLFQLQQISVEVFLPGEGGAVDAAQHRLVAVAAPIGARHLHQLEGGADLARGRHVRPTAQIHPFALLVDLQRLIVGNGVDEFNLEGFAARLKEALGLVARPFFLGEGRVAADDLAHLLFNRAKFFRRERLGAMEIVIEAVVDHRPDGHLRSRIKRLHGLGQNVRAIVADQLQRARIFAAHELDSGIAMQPVGKVSQHAVNGHGHRALGQRGGDRLCDLDA